MKNLTLILIFFALVDSKEYPINSVTDYNKSLKDLKNFCTGKKVMDFCSKEHLQLAEYYLLKQSEQIRMKMIEDQRDAVKAKRLREQNRLNGKRWLWILREHFLDRHF
jgi:hypothetical protein